MGMGTGTGIRDFVVLRRKPAPAAAPSTVVLGPSRGWRGPGLLELWRSRELLFFFTWRDIKVRYKQTLLGAAWALIQPLASMLVFTIFFHQVARIPSTGGLPYPLFSYVGLLPWLFVSRAVSGASHSLVGNAELITRIYFPRLVLPLGVVVANLADFAISLGLFFVLLLGYGRVPSPLFWIALPLLTLEAMALALGLSLLLGAIQVFFRDIGYALNFFIQLWMFATPVAYPFHLVPTALRPFAMLNPLAGIVEDFRSALLGQPWDPGLSASALLLTLLLLLLGMGVFHRLERNFADII